MNNILYSFSSIIGNEEESSHYELHIAVKDYCFGRDDRLIGVSVMQLKNIQDQVIDIVIMHPHRGGRGKKRRAGCHRRLPKNRKVGGSPPRAP